MSEHPITPPPELVEQWATQSPIQANDENWYYEYHVATQAARWAADQELEACVEHLKRSWSPSATIDNLRASRRPKPPSLKEQALVLIEVVEVSQDACSSWDFSVVRRALESLPD